MYNNAYNRRICSKISEMTKNMINHENAVNNEGDHEHKVTTRLEGMTMRKKNLQGGDGYAAATLGDHGYQEDSTLGAGHSRPRRTRKVATVTENEGSGVTIGSGVSAAGVSAAGVSAAGVTAAGRRKKQGSGVTGGDLSLLHYNELKGQPAFTAPANAKETVATIPPSAKARSKLVTTKADMPAAYVAGAKPARSNARNEIVRKVMREKSLNLPAASKYVKEHGLYQPKGK